MSAAHSTPGHSTPALLDYRRAGYGAVAVETADEAATLAALLAELPANVPVWRVSAVPGLANARDGKLVDPKVGYSLAWERAASHPGAVLVVHDWHHLARQPVAYRPLLDALPKLRAAGCTCYLMAPSWTLPAELTHELPVHREPMPGAEALAGALDVIAEASGISHPDATRAALVDAARGLCGQEAESAFALAAVRGELTPAVVSQRKAAIIRQTPGLEVYDALPESVIGGLRPLTDHLRHEIRPSRADAQLRGKGMLLVGPPGTGKSQYARVVASILGYPLVIRLDPGAMMGSLVGQSESQMRGGLAVSIATAPVLLWIDEIDSALGGAASSDRTDGGTTSRVVSTLLTFLAELTADVYVVATANMPERIPAALTRPGRLDSIWSIDLPTLAERALIASVHLARLNCGACDACPEALATVSDGFSGAELAAAVLAAARRTERHVTPDSLVTAAGQIVPLSRSRSADLDRMREWARTNARPANSQDDETTAAPPKGSRRKLNTGGAGPSGSGEAKQQAVLMLGGQEILS